jgi:hypothetical protein
VLGYPQLYIEGNHRTGSPIADWISVYYGFPPFDLPAENALAYFAPSIEIKQFANKSTGAVRQGCRSIAIPSSNSGNTISTLTTDPGLR